MGRTTKIAKDRPAAAAQAAAAAPSRLPLPLVPTGGSAVVRATGEAQRSIARRAGELQAEASRQLRHATNPGELLAVQAAWLMASWQHSLQSTREMTDAWMGWSASGAERTRH
jgi:hypothetical protein